MQIGDLDLGLIPIKEDTLSMEMPDLYREVGMCLHFVPYESWYAQTKVMTR